MKSITIKRVVISVTCLLVLASITVHSMESKKGEKSQVNLRVEKASRQSTEPATNSTDTSTYKTPEIDTTREITGGAPQFEKVNYVKQISAAGKASLELANSGDSEYIKLMQNGFESPTFSSQVFSGVPTPVAAPANVNNLWQPSDPRDANLWQNVEFNRYENRLLDTARYSTPAHFTMNEVGNTVVHAPSDHGLQIISPAKVTMTSSNNFAA